jgi:hypothetical protein
MDSCVECVIDCRVESSSEIVNCRGQLPLAHDLVPRT